MKKDSKYNCLVVLGPTASGKTNLACVMAGKLNGEVISADSRQVYKQLDIGTGKDLHEYFYDGKPVAYHLINLVPPNEQFFLHQFIGLLSNCFSEISSRNKLPVICGGTGLYLDALHKDFALTQIPENEILRTELSSMSKKDLLARLQNYPSPHTKQVDQTSVKRIIRGIEIAEHFQKFSHDLSPTPLPYRPYYIGLNPPIEERKHKITARLNDRLQNGLVEEVRNLIAQGVSHDRLQKFGLEYKFVSLFLLGKINEDQLFTQLQTAIFQFARRQLTWFRKMEKEGINIHWIHSEQDKGKMGDELAAVFEVSAATE